MAFKPTLRSFSVRLLAPQKAYVGALLFTSFLAGMFNSLEPYLLKVIIDGVEPIKSLSQVPSFLIGGPLLYILAIIMSAVNYRFVEWLQLKLFPRLRKGVVSTFFHYLMGHSYRYFQDHMAGNLSNKISEMNTGFVNILGILDELITQLFSLLIALVFMFSVSPYFSLILLVWCMTFLGISLLFSKKIHFLSNNFSKARSRLNGYLVDTITNIISVWGFARLRYEEKKLSKYLNATVKEDRRMRWKITVLRICQDVLIVLLYAFMLGTLLVLYTQDKVTVGDFTFIFMGSTSAAMGMWWVSNRITQLAEDVGKCTQALKILTVPHELTAPLKGPVLNVRKGLVEFKDVFFHYKGSTPLFDTLNVTLKPGEKVGLVGFSGSGKTTFSLLLLRFFDIQGGQILIDGQDIKNMTLESLRSSIVFVPQDTSLFHRSIRDNIRYGALEATDEEVEEAAKKAYCHEFIEALPGGYDSFVGERGVKISGGQRQRIAIARAFLKKAPILIMDEATSALDSVTETCLQKTFQQIMKGRTSLVIAHRLSTLSSMDRLLVFDKGTIVEQGTHATLLQKKGLYYKMWSLQGKGTVLSA